MFGLQALSLLSIFPLKVKHPPNYMITLKLDENGKSGINCSFGNCFRISGGPDNSRQQVKKRVVCMIRHLYST